MMYILQIIDMPAILLVLNFLKIIIINTITFLTSYIFKESFQGNNIYNEISLPTFKITIATLTNKA